MSPRKRQRQGIIKPPLQHRIEVPKKDNMDNFQIIMVLCFFWAAMQSLMYFQSLELSLFGFFKLYCLFLGLSFLIPISLYRKKLTMSFYEYIILNLISVAPAIMAILFMLNSSFSSPTYKEEYRIISKTHTKRKTTYILESNTYADKDYLRSVTIKDDVEVSGTEFFAIHFSDGLLGLRIMERREIY